MEFSFADIRKSSLPSPRKLGLLGIAVILFAAGFILAPAPLEDGTYTTTISYNGDSASLSISFSFLIEGKVATSDPVTINTTNGEYTLAVSYSEQVHGEIDQKISFTIELYQSGIKQLISDISSFKGKIESEDYSLKISPTSFSDDAVNFSFRILRHTNFALALLLSISFLWLTELVPLAASSLLIPVILAVFSIDTATGALSQFANPIIFLFLAGFLLAEAMTRSGLDKFISVKILSFIPSNAKILMLSLMTLSAVFSMWMSNTAAAAVLIPLSIKLVDNIKLDDNSYKRALVLGVAYAATIGGIGSLIGTPPNFIAVELLREFDTTIDISFVEWFLFGLPVVIIMLPIAFLHLWIRFRPKVPAEKLAQAKQTSIQEIGEKHSFTVDQAVVSIIFVIIFGLWLTTQFHGISAPIVAIFGAVALYFTGQIEESDLNDINWNAILTFGGGLTLGTTIIRTGLADWLAMSFSIVEKFPQFLIILVIGILALLLTAIASNTASAAILIPIVMPLGIILGLNPIVTAIYVAIVCSIDFAIVIGTPPTMVAYSTRLYKVKEIFQIGIFLDFIGLIVVNIVTWVLFFKFASIV